MTRGPTVSNWSRTHHCKPQRLERPGSEDELRALVLDARARGAKVKVIGARHSWSDIAMSDDTLVSLDGMQALLELDEARGVARVEAGVRLHRLIDTLAARGFGLSIIGSVTEQSLTGVMSTGTHGSSLVHGNIPSFVVGMRLLTGTGEILELDEDHPLMPAARVGLGALGIITAVSVRVEPVFRLCETTESISFDQALASMDDIARSAEYVKLWWLPHTDSVIVFRYVRTEVEGQLARLPLWIDTNVVNKLVFPLLLRIGRRIPAWVPPLNRLVARTYLDARERIDRSDRLLSLPMPPRHREMEYAVPVERSAEAFARNRAVIEDSGVRVNFVTELRFVKGDGAWMSPASERDSCQLGAYMAEAPGIDQYFADFEAAMKALGGRPHWGKEFSATPEQLRGMYPQAEAFVAAARELDPDGVFRNRFLDRVMG